MKDIKRILLPTDFSEDSNHAMKYACELADRFAAELHVLHIIQELSALIPQGGLSYMPPANLVEELKEEASKEITQVPPEDWSEEHNVVRHVTEGTPFLEVVRYAKEHEIDLIVMGTHGRTGLAHMLLGSVAEKVVRKAGCPVLTVRHPDKKFEMP